MSRFFKFFKRHEEQIGIGHLVLGMMGGAFLATKKTGDIFDIAVYTFIGGAIGNYPPMLWGVTAGIVYMGLNNKISPTTLLD